MVSLLGKLVNFSKTKNIHVFLCGLRGSGKTTLLYKSLINDWTTITSEIEPTILYHYEELHQRGRCYGIWDFSGDSKVRDIPSYVAKQVHVTAVVFVISSIEHPDSACSEIVTRLESLYNDESCADTLFVVLFNQISHESQHRDLEAFLKGKFSSPDRFVFLTTNALEGLQNPNWSKCLDIIHDHYKKTMV